MRDELLRKLIHSIGLGYIPLYIYTGKSITLFAVATLTAFAILLEIIRRRYSIFPRWILRHYEINGVGAYFYYGISATLMTAFLPMDACFAGIVLISLGDSIAGIVKKSGHVHFAHPAMFAVCLLALLLLHLDPIASLFACAAGVMAEKFCRVGKFYINDNLTVPLASALTYALFIS